MTTEEYRNTVAAAEATRPAPPDPHGHPVPAGAPASPTWPLCRLLAGLRRWLAAVVAVVAVLVSIAAGWPGVELAARITASISAALVIGVAARVLIPAGRRPWHRLLVGPRRPRGAIIGGLLAVAATAALLIWHAATGWWPPILGAVGAVAVLWGCALADPGFGYALADLGACVTRWATDFREWWRTTKRDLRESWTEPPPG